MMNRKLVALGLVVAGVAVGGAVALGPLNPPSGAVSATNKTLTEIEPRIALPTTGPITISQSGSYYLTGNVILVASSAPPDVVTINASAVTLDLNGYAIIGGRSGILINGSSVTIRNGAVRNTGGSAIFTAAGGVNTRVSNVEIVSPTDSGIVVASGSVVEGCVISGGALGVSGGDAMQILRCTVGGTRTGAIQVGDRAVIRDCIVNTVSSGFGVAAGNFASIAGCTLTGGTTGGNGIAAGTDAQVSRCIVSNFNVGIRPGVRSMVESCNVTANQDGISAAASATIRSCTSFGNARYGIELNNTVGGIDLTSVVEACTVNNNGASGIVAFTGGNHLIRNNFLARNAASGIVVFDNNQVIGNRIGEHGAAGSAGVTVNGGGNLIQGNSFVSNGISVSLNGGANNNTVTGNTFRGGAGIVNSGVGNTVTPIVGIGSVSATTGAWVNVQY